MTKINIGILGGTFDPVHMGHLILAQEVLQSANLDKILFIPAGLAPHKDNEKIVDSKHRLNMLLLATEGNSQFEISTIEIEKKTLSYTYETLYQLKSIYKKDTLYYIIGADNVFNIETWKSFEELFKLCDLLVALRPGFDKKSVIKKSNQLIYKYNAKIQVLDIPLIDISSSDIKKAIIKKKSIKYLVPESVGEYIREHLLYQ